MKIRSIVLAFGVAGLVAFVGCSPAPKEDRNSNSTDSNATGADLEIPEVSLDDAEVSSIDDADVQGAVTTAAVDDSPSEAELEADEATVTYPVTSELDPVEVELGAAELTAGIPGDGDLSNEAIEEWLQNPENHRPIQPTLPLGLSAAASNIQGLDANPMTKAKIELGRQLYFDTRLSSDNTISCASCHHPDFGYAKDTQFGVGVQGQEGNRNSPVSYNRIVSGPQFWDGRADSLEAQAVGPIANPIEMANTHDVAVQTIKGIPGYVMQFDAVFPGEGVNIDNVGKAIATFERAIVTSPAPYDYFEQVTSIESSWGDEIDELEEEDPELFAAYTTAVEGAKAMSESAKRGRDLFFSDKANCTACHAGANFTDELYHNLGVGMDADEPDLGRFVVTNDEKDKGAFKTPTVRNVALSAPYMHDGSQKTLEEVVEWYAKGGHPNDYLSDKMKKLDLTDQDKTDLVNFMKEGLTSDFPKVEAGRLPL
ncbi:MAG: c-type cytochrome [Planctomycetales bacterium]|nr:c-type cytochrome [Planctomycetales bacterium]